MSLFTLNHTGSGSELHGVNTRSRRRFFHLPQLGMLELSCRQPLARQLTPCASTKRDANNAQYHRQRGQQSFYNTYLSKFLRFTSNKNIQTSRKPDLLQKENGNFTALTHDACQERNHNMAAGFSVIISAEIMIFKQPIHHDTCLYHPAVCPDIYFIN